MPKNSIRHALTNTTKRLLIKYLNVQSKIKMLTDRKNSILSYFYIRKNKKAMLRILKKTKEAIFRWVTSSLNKYGLCNNV